jgi:hypothetical protein
MRPYLGFFLALLLALTGQSMVVARGMPDAAGNIVLCTGSGPMVVSVDENGQPVGAPHICPDFAASLFAFTPEQPMVLQRPLGRVEALRLASGIGAMSQQRPTAMARGPPVWL